MTRPASDVDSFAFGADGRTLEAAVLDGSDKHGKPGTVTIRTWRKLLWHSLPELRTEVCALVGDSLSRMEWARFAAGITYRAGCP